MAEAIQCCTPACDGAGGVQLKCDIHYVCGDCFIAKGKRREDASQCSICLPASPKDGASDEPPESAQQLQAPQVQRSVSSEPGIWIYVDNSNIWIEAKKLTSKIKKLRTKEDFRARIDTGKLTDVVAKGRRVEQGFLYGSEPPPIDKVWEKIEEQGWKVDTKERHILSGKEKKVDTQLAVDVTERACTTPENKRSTIVLITGDADLKPAVMKVLDYDGWKVEVYMWKHAISRELKDLSTAKSSVSDRVTVYFLDEYLETVTFTNLKFNLRDNMHLLPQVKTYGVVFSMRPRAFKKHLPPYWWCRQLESIAQWPFQYYWFRKERLDRSESDDLVLVFRKIDSQEFDLNSFVDTIEKRRPPHVLNAIPFTEFYQDKEFDRAAIERIGYLSLADISAGAEIHEEKEGADSEVIHEEEEGWSVAQRPPQKQKKQRYSTPCPHGVHCRRGMKCLHKHTDKEKIYFRNNKGIGNPLLKASPCHKHPNCRRKKEDCNFAHGEEDAWCLNCREYAGHYTEDCPKTTKE